MHPCQGNLVALQNYSRLLCPGCTHINAGIKCRHCSTEFVMTVKRHRDIEHWPRTIMMARSVKHLKSMLKLCNVFGEYVYIKMALF